MPLRVASSQFPVGPDLTRNLEHVRAQVAEAADQGARVISFPETALCGYTPWERPSLAGFDWGELQEATRSVAGAAAEHGLWILLGTIAPSEDPQRPFNAVLALDPSGELRGRYHKRLLAAGELAHFTPGREPLLLEIEGFRCGVAICHEWRYPEVYREYARLGADVVFQCWYDGAYDDAAWESEGRDLAEVIPATTRAHAVCNHLWIVGSNTSRPHCCFGAFVVRPDGVQQARAHSEHAEVLVTTLTEPSGFPDPSGHHRPRLLGGGPIG